MKKSIFLKIIYLSLISIILVGFTFDAKNNERTSTDNNLTASQTGGKKWVAPKIADHLKNPLANNPSAAAAGKNLFNMYCVTCHGSKGLGNGVGAAGLNPKPANLTSSEVQKQSDGAIFWKITTGNPPMLSWRSTLTKTQRWQLVDYIRELKK